MYAWRSEVIFVLRLLRLANACGPARRLQRLAMDVGVGVRSAVQSLVETERPQNRDIGPERDTGLAQLERVKRVPVDARLGGQFGDRCAAAGPGKSGTVTELFDALGHLYGNGFLDSHYF